MRRSVGPIAAIILISAPVLASWAQTVNTTASAQVETTPQQVGYGVGSVLGTLVYAPFKATFCVLGSIVSVPTLAFGTDKAGKVVGASCRGTWVITPDAVKGKERVNFVGNTSRE
jgi:hypothetical protein